MLSFSDKRKFRQAVLLHDGNQHIGKSCGVTDLILHMVMAFKNREMPLRIGFFHGIPVFEMVFHAAKFKIAVPPAPGNALQPFFQRLRSDSSSAYDYLGIMKLV